MPDEISTKRILLEPWPAPPDFETNARWVFLHVDVIGHSLLFHDDMSDTELLSHHELLRNLRETVHNLIGDFHEDMEWDWAGDGGIFAFHVPVPRGHTTEKAVLVAELIRNAVRKNNEYQEDPTLRIEVRIVLTRGLAYYYPKKELRCGSALNKAAKLRVRGERTSIAITHSVYVQLQKNLKDQFRAVEPVEGIDERVYVYIPALHDALKQEEGDPMQAAHFAYRLGVLNFETGLRQEAVNAFQSAETFISLEKHPHRYYHRTLTAFYRLWRAIAESTDDQSLAKFDQNDRRDSLRKLALNPELKELFGAKWQFLHEMEFCIEQLDILARYPVADPSGLTSMQICLLLERFGYPRRWYGSAIAARFARIEEELATTPKDTNIKFPTGTMDRGCSLCTAVAASCLILEKDNDEDAEDDHDPQVQTMINWLTSKKNKRFSFRSKHVDSRVEDSHHALHYAASVLQALIDYDPRHHMIRDVVDVFFTIKTSDDALTQYQDETHRAAPNLPDFPKHWVKYLHIPYFDFACYIFSAFARTIIACDNLKSVVLTDDRCSMFRTTLAVLAKRLLNDADLAQIKEDAGRIYAARENLGSFALGLLIDQFPANAVEMFKGVRNLIAAVASVDRLEPPNKRKTTIDSNFDRMWRMLDGWLLQWECALVARERNVDIRRELAGLFPDI